MEWVNIYYFKRFKIYMSKYIVLTLKIWTVWKKIETNKVNINFAQDINHWKITMLNFFFLKKSYMMINYIIDFLKIYKSYGLY